jgi:hypothetical protein
MDGIQKFSLGIANKSLLKKNSVGGTNHDATKKVAKTFHLYHFQAILMRTGHSMPQRSVSIIKLFSVYLLTVEPPLPSVSWPL